jgi:hypothetical protein
VAGIVLSGPLADVSLDVSLVSSRDSSIATLVDVSDEASEPSSLDTA